MQRFSFWKAFGAQNVRRISTIVQEKERECFLSIDGAIANINLNRPSRKNAFGKLMISQLNEVLNELSVASITTARVIVIRSLVEGCFSAGADLKERAEMPQDQVDNFVSLLRGTFSKVEALEMPTIAAIDGVALGGGLELALCCDLRYAGLKAKVGLPETKLAILPAAGGSQRLPRLIGASKAKELIFTGRILNSLEAEQFGLVNEGDPKLSGIEKAYKTVELIIRNGPLALKYAKEAISKGIEMDIQGGLEIERLCYAQLIPTEDRLEGLRAFKERRPPVYKGK